MAEERIRVLLADDHAVVRAGIRQFLERAGDIEVIAEADDGQQAQAAVLDSRPDVAVLDIQMPKATGIEVTRWIRANAPATSVLILTAYDDDPYVLAVLRAGAHGYVLKTASPAEIVQAVRDVQAGKTAFNQAIVQKLASFVAQPKNEPPVESLTERELEVLTKVARGYTNKAIAALLGISDRTVQGHIANIFRKMGASSRTEAVMRAISLGLISQNAGDER